MNKLTVVFPTVTAPSALEHATEPHQIDVPNLTALHVLPTTVMPPIAAPSARDDTARAHVEADELAAVLPTTVLSTGVAPSALEHAPGPQTQAAITHHVAAANIVQDHVSSMQEGHQAGEKRAAEPTEGDLQALKKPRHQADGGDSAC